MDKYRRKFRFSWGVEIEVNFNGNWYVDYSVGDEMIALELAPSRRKAFDMVRTDLATRALVKVNPKMRLAEEVKLLMKIREHYCEQRKRAPFDL